MEAFKESDSTHIEGLAPAESHPTQPAKGKDGETRQKAPFGSSLTIRVLAVITGLTVLYVIYNERPSSTPHQSVTETLETVTHNNDDVLDEALKIKQELQEQAAGVSSTPHQSVTETLEKVTHNNDGAVDEAPKIKQELQEQAAGVSSTPHQSVTETLEKVTHNNDGVLDEALNIKQELQEQAAGGVNVQEPFSLTRLFTFKSAITFIILQMVLVIVAVAIYYYKVNAEHKLYLEKEEERRRVEQLQKELEEQRQREIERETQLEEERESQRRQAEFRFKVLLAVKILILILSLIFGASHPVSEVANRKQWCRWQLIIGAGLVSVFLASTMTAVGVLCGQFNILFIVAAFSAGLCGSAIGALLQINSGIGGASQMGPKVWGGVAVLSMLLAASIGYLA